MHARTGGCSCQTKPDQRTVVNAGRKNDRSAAETFRNREAVEIVCLPWSAAELASSGVGCQYAAVKKRDMRS